MATAVQTIGLCGSRSRTEAQIGNPRSAQLPSAFLEIPAIPTHSVSSVGTTEIHNLKSASDARRAVR
jgi:hypothetical protein